MPYTLVRHFLLSIKNKEYCCLSFLPAEIQNVAVRCQENQYIFKKMCIMRIIQAAHGQGLQWGFIFS